MVTIAGSERLVKSGWQSSRSQDLGICGVWKLGFFCVGGVLMWFVVCWGGVELWDGGS